MRRLVGLVPSVPPGGTNATNSFFEVGVTGALPATATLNSQATQAPVFWMRAA